MDHHTADWNPRFQQTVRCVALELRRSDGSFA